MSQIISYTEYLQSTTLAGIEQKIRDTVEKHASYGAYSVTIMTKWVGKYAVVARKLEIPHKTSEGSITFDWS